MDELLTKLLLDLKHIGEHHDEICDGDVRVQICAAVLNGFVRQIPGFSLPESFGMLSDEGDRLVKEALERYIAAAKQQAVKQGLTTFHDRLAAFQNENVVTPNGSHYHDFFAWSSPNQFNG